MKLPTTIRIANFLKDARVGIAGAGGLGSNCAVALARTGIGFLHLVDFDKVELSNLNRQYFFLDQLGMYKVDALKQNIARVNRETRVITYNETLTHDNIGHCFEGCSIIIEALDKTDQKQMLAEYVLEKMPNVTLVMASGLAGYQSTEMKIYRSSNLIVCGDLETEVSDDKPPMAPRVGIVALMQANEAINLLLKEFK